MLSEMAGWPGVKAMESSIYTELMPFSKFEVRLMTRGGLLDVYKARLASTRLSFEVVLFYFLVLIVSGDASAMFSLISLMGCMLIVR